MPRVSAVRNLGEGRLPQQLNGAYAYAYLLTFSWSKSPSAFFHAEGTAVAVATIRQFKIVSLLFPIFLQ